MLPELDKVLYLDGDILIRDSLEELFDEDIDDVYAAVCKDLGAETYPSPYNDRLGIQHKAYFNSGVMVLNLKKNREEGIEEKLFQYRENGINHFMDQDAFNVVFDDSVILIDVVYNMSTSCWTITDLQTINEYYDHDYHNKGECYLSAKILHLTTPEKPWLYLDVIGSEEWIAYYMDSPFFRLGIIRKPYGKSKFKGLIENDCDYYAIVAHTNTKIPFRIEHTPLVSVITPVFNTQAYLFECIESLLLQSQQSAEFLFIDDGSTDDSMKILDMFRHFDARIKVLSLNHCGAGPARNVGMQHARGKYITFLDSDDIMLHSALEILLGHAEKYDADISMCAFSAFSTDRDETWIDDSGLRPELIPNFEPFSSHTYPKYLFQLSTGQPWGKVFRRGFIENNRITFPSLPRSEDIPFTHYAMAIAERIVCLPGRLILHRIVKDNGSLEQNKDKSPNSNYDARVILWEKLKEAGLSELLKQSFDNSMLEGFFYNLKTMRTEEGYKAVYDSFRNQAIPRFHLSFKNSGYYYNKIHYLYLKQVASTPYNKRKARNNMGKKLLGGVQCFQDHGFGYTLRRALYHIGLWEDEETPKSPNNRPKIFRVSSKLRCGIQCYRDNGPGYTLRRTLYHIGLWEDEEAPKGPDNRLKLYKLFHPKKDR